MFYAYFIAILEITADGPAHSSYITDNHAARSDTHQLLFRLSLALLLCTLVVKSLFMTEINICLKGTPNPEEDTEL